MIQKTYNSTKKLIKKLFEKEFIRFGFVGGVSTLVDWTIFFILAITINLNYQIAVVSSYLCGAIVNYTLNKLITFKSTSKKIAHQFGIFIGIATISLFASMGLMFTLIELATLDKMTSRIITTGIIFIANYFLHKHITFNKKWFN